MTVSDKRAQVLAVLKCGATQSIASHFGDPAEKAAVRTLVREGVAIIVREETPVKPGHGARIAWLVAKLAPKHAARVQSEDRELATQRAQLHAASCAALRARDAIEACCTPAWSAAHSAAREACQTEQAFVRALSHDPATRYGSWRTVTDRELQLFGYL